MQKNFLNLKNYLALNEVFKRLNCLRRWTSVTTHGKYNEMNKQALNCITAYMLASFSEKDGITISWERFPKIALYRAFQKVYVYFDTPEHIINKICEIGKINKSAFDTATKDFITELTDEDFSAFICEGIGTYEMDIYRAATKIATLVELVENAPLIKDLDEYTTKLCEITKYISTFKAIPGVLEFSDTNGIYFKLLTKISMLRNQNRWAAQPYLINCSVAGHLFNAGDLAYLIGLEKFNETLATKMFFMGIFHDVPETWTSDIPSPIKNRIVGLRAASELYEADVLKDNVFNIVPDFMGNKLHEIMFEEESNASFHSLIKAADYLSADYECWLQYIAGSRDTYFLKAIESFEKQLSEGTYELPPVAKQLHDYYLKFSRNVVTTFIDFTDMYLQTLENQI